MSAAMVIEAEATLAALAEFRSALVPISVLPDLFNMAEADALDTVAELEAAGLVETWADEEYLGFVPHIILSSYAAELLGVELQPPGSATDAIIHSRWVRLGARKEPCFTRPERESLETDLSSPNIEIPWSFDRRIDEDAPDPAEVVEAADEDRAAAEKQAKGKPRETPERWPTLILGARAVWPVGVREDGTCEGCHGEWSRKGCACLVCNRSWSDGPDAPPIQTRVVSARKAAPEPGTLAGGTGEAPKTKRKAKGKKLKIEAMVARAERFRMPSAWEKRAADANRREFNNLFETRDPAA